MLSEQKKIEFENISGVLIKWLNENCHPHAKIIIDTASAELVEGIHVFNTIKYIKD